MRIAIDKPLARLTAEERLNLLDRRPPRESGLAKEVRGILEEVRTGGDPALKRMARDFDGVVLESLEIPPEAWRGALARLEPELRKALEEAAANIRIFHSAQAPDEG